MRVADGRRLTLESYRFDETAYPAGRAPAGGLLPALDRRRPGASSRLCAEHGVPIVARGAGTGLSGGAVAVDGGLTVVVHADERDPRDRRGQPDRTTQPGIINADLNRAVAEHGLFYPPDPASFEMCTIGGNLAENSGGLRCVKYGVTRDWVLGLEVVLADGSVIRTGGKNIKDVAGYDLTGVFVGSEGTLGLITEATLRLLPLPPAKLTMIAFFPTVARRRRGGLAHHRGGHRAGHARADGRIHDRGRRRRAPARPRPHGRGDADGRVGSRRRGRGT